MHVSIIVYLLTRWFLIPVFAIFSASIFAIVLVANEPLAGQRPATTRNANFSEYDVVLVLDNSGSMKRNDHGFLIKQAVSGFAKDLTKNSRLAIVLFDTTAKIILKLTKVSEANFAGLLGHALDQIDYRGQWTDIPGGLELALYELRKQGTPEAVSVIVLLTDGIVDLGSTAKNIERTQWLNQNLLPQTKQQGIRVYGIALSQSADVQLVQSLSSGTQGDYIRVPAAADIFPAFQQIISQFNESVKDSKLIEDVLDTVIDSEQQESSHASEKTPEEVKSMLPDRELFDDNAIETQPNEVPETQEISRVGEGNRSEFQQESVQDSKVSTKAPKNADRNQQESDAIGRSLFTRVPAWVVIGLFSVALALLAVIAFIMHRRKPIVKSSSLATLYDINADTDQERYSLDAASIRIGRSEKMNDIVIAQPTVSSQHAIIKHRNGKFYLRDLGSTNGTYINNIKVYKTGQIGEVGLKNHDLITIDRYKFRFSCEEPVVNSGTSQSSRFASESTITSTTMGFAQASAPQESDDTSKYSLAMCPNHPQKIANEICAVCNKAFCTQCMREQQSQWLCSECHMA